MSNNIKQEVYIHQNFNGNEISNATLKDNVIHNSTTNNRPTPNIGEKKGLLYYDSDIDRIMVWDGNVWNTVQYIDDLKRLTYNANLGTQLTQTYELPLLFNIVNSDSKMNSVSLNGVRLLSDTYSIQPDGNGFKLVINTDLLGYNIDTTPPEDFLQLEFSVL